MCGRGVPRLPGKRRSFRHVDLHRPDLQVDRLPMPDTDLLPHSAHNKTIRGVCAGRKRRASETRPALTIEAVGGHRPAQATAGGLCPLRFPKRRSEQEYNTTDWRFVQPGTRRHRGGLRSALSGGSGYLLPFGCAGAASTKSQAPKLKQTRNAKRLGPKHRRAAPGRDPGTRQRLRCLVSGPCLFEFVWVLVLGAWCFRVRDERTIL